MLPCGLCTDRVVRLVGEKGLDWVEGGVWNEDVAGALRSCAQNSAFSQRTRHRAWSHAKAYGH